MELNPKSAKIILNVNICISISYRSKVAPLESVAVSLNKSEMRQKTLMRTDKREKK